MKINIDISVIIPAFNAADSIGVLVHTLLGETTLSTEIIVVDDGSTDETWTVLSAITDERLILIRQENQGVYAARNAALAIYRGEWVVFLDADDRVLGLYRRRVNDRHAVRARFRVRIAFRHLVPAQQIQHVLRHHPERAV